IKGLNPNTGYSTDVYVHTPLVPGVFSITAPDIPAGLIVQYGFSVTGLNGNPAHLASNGFATVTAAPLARENFEAAALRAYPNPATDFITFSAAASIESVTLYNTLGQAVLSQKASSREARLDMSALPTGLYVAQLYVSGRPATIRVQKQ